MKNSYIKIQICGDVERGRTVAELTFADKYLGLIYDSSEGFIAELNSPEAVSLPADSLTQAISQAKSRLLEYVNRCGENSPEGLSAAGFSLWLMEKTDRTAMEVKLE